MGESKKKYVVYGMRAACSQGTMQNYLSTEVGHGVIYQGQPLLNANDHIPGVNLTHFGDCNSRELYEEAKRQTAEKYKVGEDDGLFEKVGKFVAKAATSTVLSIKENFGVHKCGAETLLASSKTIPLVAAANGGGRASSAAAELAAGIAKEMGDALKGTTKEIAEKVAEAKAIEQEMYYINK